MTLIKFIFIYNCQSLNSISEKIGVGNGKLFYFNGNGNLKIFIYKK